jgi:alpha-amylase
MRSSKTVVFIALTLILVSGCTPAPTSPQVSVATSQAPEEVFPTPTDDSVNKLVRIRLTTTSDWTTLDLMAGTTWLESQLVTASTEATRAEVGTSQLILEQPIGRAEDGGMVEMITETLCFPWESKRSVILSIERGNLGYTELELSRQVDGQWVVVKRAKWEGLSGDLNQYQVEITADQLFGEISSPDEITWHNADPMPVEAVTGMPLGTDGYAWWNDSIFYEIFVRSFYDSDGDGIGDLEGIIEKLDYLNDGDPDTTEDLGVSGIWLMPIYPSPSYHGYNATDFKNVNPQYGTLQDLRDLVDAAHQRGIRVILDYVVGQTSYQHPWFLASKNPSSPYRDWYIWVDHDPGYTGSWGQQVWFPYGGSYYYSTFSEYSPDLNLKNPEVNEQIRDAIRFWLEDVGVDGFRMDSAKHAIEEGQIQANSASTHQWWKDFRTFYKGVNPEAMTVAEIWEPTEIDSQYLQGDEFDLSFEFWISYEILNAVNSGDASIINQQMELSTCSIPGQQFATFLTNHDEERLMDQLDYSPDKNRVAASILLTSPGVPFLFYGEEVGLQGLKPDEQIRSPMHWSGDPNAGFTTGSPWQPLAPDWESYNVVNMSGDPASLLSHYRDLIAARNQHAALRVGEPSVVYASDNVLYSILRVSQEEAVLVLVNLSGEAITDYWLDLESSGLAEGSYIPAGVMGEGPFAALRVTDEGGFSRYLPVAEVPPYATFILQLQPAD